MKAIQVKDWDKKFEIAQSRKLKHMQWVAIPNNHRGGGYMALSEHPKAAELFAAFILIVEVASTMRIRGLLVSNSGRPLTARNLAKITYFPVSIFDSAFKELIKPEIGWLEMANIGSAVGDSTTVVGSSTTHSTLQDKT